MLLALATGAQAGIDIMLPWHGPGSYGFSATIDGRVTTVFPGMSAAAAGMKAGDVIDVASLDAPGRRRLAYFSLAPVGQQQTFPVVRDGARREVTLTALPESRTFADNLTDVIEVLGRLAALVIATALLLLRPSLLTWSFFFITSGAEGGAAVLASIGTEQLPWLVAFLNAIAIAAAVSGVIFAMLFPRTVPTSWERLAALALALFGVAWFVFDEITGYSVWFSFAVRGTAGAVRLIDTINIRLTLGLYVLAVIIFVANYVRTRREERVRMRWVALGFAIGAIGAFGPAATRALFNISPPLAVTNILLSFGVFIPIAVAYAVLRHRVIDLRFVVGRALVYGSLTTVAVVLLALLDFVVARQIEETRLGIAVEIVGAVLIGLGMNRLHGWIDDAVDRYVFRTIHAAERRLAVVGRSLLFASSPEALDAMLCDEASAALKLTHVRVVRDLDDGDPLVLELRAERTTLARDEDVIVPLLVRHDVLGYIAYGPHCDGSAIDPTERKILEQLTHAAAIATDHLDAERRLAENRRLQVENDLLRSLVSTGARQSP